MFTLTARPPRIPTEVKKMIVEWIKRHTPTWIALSVFVLGVVFLMGYQKGLSEALLTFSGSSEALRTNIAEQTGELKKVGETLDKIEKVLKSTPQESAWTPNRTRSIAEIRKDMYGANSTKKILITYHEGGKVLPYGDMRKTVKAVFQRLPNIRTTDNLVDLVMETMIVETHLGGEKWSVGISKWKNYGIGQFVMSTARSTLTWLKDIRPDVHEAVMSLYDKKHDLVWNITNNIPFSIAMIVQYYWRVCPDIYANIHNLHARSMLWKKIYNSPAGLGTPEVYRKRVNSFMKTVERDTKKPTRS